MNDVHKKPSTVCAIDQHNFDKIQQENLFLKTVVNELPTILYWKNLDGAYVWFNQYALKQYLSQISPNADIKMEDCIGKTDYDFFPKDIADKYRKNDMLVIKGKKELALEEKITIADGSEVIQLTVKKPLFDNNQKVIGIIGITFDITDRIKAEEYRLKHELAQKIIKFSNLVAGSIAHELKNPLAGIRLQMESLQAMNPKKMSLQNFSSFLKNMAKTIIRTIDATTYVIDGMLKKLRFFAAGKVYHDSFEKNFIASDIKYLLQTYPFKNNEADLVKIKLTDKFQYMGDKTLTAHVLSNLMKNALYAIKETDKPNANITIETIAAKDFNLLLFKDTGIGIAKDLVDKIFDQFETKKNIHGGTGLGLAFCKSVMEDNYGGKIACNSKEGEYAEFVLSFPKINPKFHKHNKKDNKY